MPDPYVLNPHPPEFDQFLYASVGEDRNGHAVTVLSTLARLGFDPWKEAAELVTLGRTPRERAWGHCLLGFAMFLRSPAITAVSHETLASCFPKAGRQVA